VLMIGMVAAYLYTSGSGKAILFIHMPPHQAL
jgi:hypothetical protein